MASTSSNPHLSFDAGLLLSTDSSSLDLKQYDNAISRENLIQSRVLASTKGLLSQLYALPITIHPDHGPLAALPAPKYPLLPREKPLPKPKAETKWEAFAKRKGIQHRKKDKMVWDEEAKEWVPSWGYKGKNKKEEEQWIHEIPANAEDGFNPVSALKKARKEKNLHNKAQQLKNVARANAASGKSNDVGDKSSALLSKDQSAAKRANAGVMRKVERERKIAELDAEVKRGRVSTASMGRFDKHLQGEGKEKGLKRKFDANEVDANKERASNLALIEKMTSGAIKSSRRSGDKGLVNERKAVRFASAGKGSAALARKGDKKVRK